MLFKGLSVREPAPLAPGRVGGVAAALTVVVTAGARRAVFPTWGRPGASERRARLHSGWGVKAVRAPSPSGGART